MKQIINGKIYNTDTAEHIGHVSGGGPSVTDFTHWSGDLYVTKKGAYFIQGSGGASSIFAQQLSENECSGGSGILVLKHHQALAMAEADLDSDVIEQFFDVEEG